MDGSRMRLVLGVLAAVCLIDSTRSPGNLLDMRGRVADRRTIEEVYWRHRIWPSANPGPKPPLAAVLTTSLIRNRVEDDLLKRAALVRFWERALSATQIQAEIDRMAARSHSPGVLKELFAALGNDPQRVAQGLAEPALADRLLRAWYAGDPRFHETSRRKAERASLLAHSVQDMRQLEGQYLEAEYLRSDTPVPASLDQETGSIPLDPAAWDELRERLAKVFDRNTGPASQADALPRRVVSRLQEEGDAFRIYALLEAGEDRLRVATVTWAKRPFEEWWQEARVSLAPDPTPVTGPFTLPEVSTSCADDTWSSMITDFPYGRSGHTAVWTGSEMIVWGGMGRVGPLDTGYRYGPATDTWVSIANDAATPAPRTGHTAVWTGTEMIVWGASSSVVSQSGGRYDPLTDSWRTVRADANSPSPRRDFAAAWTGESMIIWGGFDTINAVYVKSGARYDPVSDTWSPTRSDATAPEARAAPRMVWTGSEMIVWGGFKQAVCCFQGHDDVATGGRYDPLADSWTLISGGGGRSGHTAVWTGSEMIVWGGIFRTHDLRGNDITTVLNNGARYSPASNSWTATRLDATTPSARSGHTAVWTGSEMIVWGSGTNTGGRYTPGSDTWVSTRADTTAPAARSSHTAVWTGSEMIVWGGNTNTGGRFDPAHDTWGPTATNGAFPSGIAPLGSAAWTGSEMIVWSGPFSAGRYDPATDRWTGISGLGTPSAGAGHTTVWTGTEMIVWGGNSNNGGRYDPTTDRWTATTLDGAPDPRSYHSAVWTGTEMIIWGGYTCCTFFNTGARYDPLADRWTMTRADETAPMGRWFHTAVWTGSEMIVWGGENQNVATSALNSGGRYDPVADSWVPTKADSSGPDARNGHTAVWTGSEMIVWGGISASPHEFPLSATGWIYDPASDSWRTTRADATAPEGRYRHGAVWTGSEMIVWGGDRESSVTGMLSSGGRYAPGADAWTATRNDATTPLPRVDSSFVWTGNAVIVWGGLGVYSSYLDTGGLYCASKCAQSTFFLDADGDDHGNPANPIQACTPPAGYVTPGDDCSDADASVWGTPSEVRDLVLPDSVVLGWSAPAVPGGSALLYDLLRSDSPADFVSAVTCVASDGTGTTATDPTTPARGRAFYYLVRGQNGCPNGQGPLGTTSSGAPIAGRACP